MHATYCFLFHYDNDNPTDNNVMSEYSDYLGGDNYHQEMMIVTDKGGVYNLCNDNDYRGRAQLAELFIRESEGDRWQAALKFAEDCVLDRIGVNGVQIREDGLYGRKELLRYLRSELAKNVGHEHPNVIARMAIYLRQVDCVLEWPFTQDLVEPHASIRAMDFNFDGEEGNLAILFTDIHF